MSYYEENSDNQLEPQSPQLEDMTAVTVSPQPPSEASGHGSAAACSSADEVKQPPAAAAANPLVKRVCFICGSHTSQTINIYERRAGPNLVEVINAKFKVAVSKQKRNIFIANIGLIC